MLNNLRKLFGVDESRPTVVRERQQEPLMRDALGQPRGSHSPVSPSVVGQTLVVTIIDPDLNAFKAADVNHAIREVFESERGVRNLVIDMENIKFLDSAGLNTFVDLVSMVRQRQGKIAVAAAGQQVEVLFKLTRLELIFKIRRTTLEALDAVEREG
ncbi:MAG: STAS domain-containing protein [Phycisphaeraceae bacterium]|nr:STAS domain-containing protein [Phycisphaeraceae bacterium]